MIETALRETIETLSRLVSSDLERGRYWIHVEDIGAGDGAGSIWIVADEDAARVQPAPCPPADVEIVLNGDDLSSLLAGDVAAFDLHSARRLILRGSHRHAFSLLRCIESRIRRPSATGRDGIERRSGVPPGRSAPGDADPSRSEVLRSWVNSHHLRPDRIEAYRVRVGSAPPPRFLVLDDFFHKDRLDSLIDQHATLRFAKDDAGLNFDSEVVFARRDEHIGADFFFSSDWHRYAAYLMGVELANPGVSLVRLRRHPADAHGFWPHSDRVNDGNGTRQVVAMAYFNPGWGPEHGAHLQYWDLLESRRSWPANGSFIRWTDYLGKRLAFLESEREMAIEVPVGNEGLSVCRLRLIEQVAPEYNRMVIAEMVSSPCIHSVTPSRGRVRSGFVQWMY